VRAAQHRPDGIARGSALDPARSKCLWRSYDPSRSRAVIPTRRQTTKRLAFLGSLRTNNSSLDDLIGVKELGNGIQIHRERKQKAETYLLTSPLIVDGLVVTGAMIQLAIDMAKQLAQGALEGAPPRSLVWKKSPFFEGSGNPLHCGSLYEYEMSAGGALVRSSAERGQREQEKTAAEAL
jgi:hypothetical protein